MRVIRWLPLLLCSGAAAQEPVVPAELAPFLTDGVVATGDYRWMRGQFPGADAAALAVARARTRFTQTCIAHSRAATTATFAGTGRTFDPRDRFYVQSAACRQFNQPRTPAGTSWEAFAAAAERARPYAVGLLRGVELAEDQVLRRGDFAQQLRTRAVGEQALRNALGDSWQRRGPARDLSDLERGLYESMISRGLGERDDANTRWLAGMVAAEGWPKRSAVGDAAARAAWLLAQHADDDPAFQLRALRLMEPLAATGEAEPQFFALLTDRVELKLSGRQVYGTQWTCEGGRRLSQPLAHDRAETDRRRAAMKLDTLAQDAARMDATYGPCPR